MKHCVKIFIALILTMSVWGFSPLTAHADEVDIVPTVTYELTVHSSFVDQSLDYTGRVYQEVPRSGQAFPFDQTGRYFGNYSDAGFPDSPVYIYSSDYDGLIQNLPSDYCAQYYLPSQAQDFSITFDGLHIGLDMTGNINGYYRYTCDFGLGAFGVPNSVYYRQSTFDLTPTYTYNSAPLSIGDSENGMHCVVYLVGENEWTTTMYQDTKVVNSLIRFHMESTFYFDSTYGYDISFDLSPVFSSMIGSLNFDCSALRSGGINSYSYFAYNNRFSSKLFGNVEPPVTPTPSPTPYPGQDTQESINQGVQTIIQGLDVQATPIPHPEELTIDETIFDVLDDMTLPDVSPAQSTFTNLWDIFNPLWAFVGLMAGSMTLVGIFLYCLKGRFV